MNVRRSIVYAALSLLLVLSQQMGMTHALSHWSVQRDKAELSTGRGGAVVKAPALDLGCEQCLAFAQIGSALDTPFHSFPAARSVAVASVAGGSHSVCQRTVCAFRSRAPPASA